jgi:hypothetical protein
VFWLSFWSDLYEPRPSAELFVLDDYRPVPPVDGRAT